MTGAFAVFGESTFEMLNCYFIFINYLYLRSTIATIRILNVYYYKVLKYSVVCLSVFEKKNRKRHQVRYRHCFDKNVGMKKIRRMLFVLSIVTSSKNHKIRSCIGTYSKCLPESDMVLAGRPITATSHI